MITANPLIDGLYKITLAPAEVKRRTKELLLKIIGPIEISTARLLPSGGTTGQVLKKQSNTDYDTIWQNESGGGGGSSYIPDVIIDDSDESTDGVIHVGIQMKDGNSNNINETCYLQLFVLDDSYGYIYPELFLAVEAGDGSILLNEKNTKLVCLTDSSGLLTIDLYHDENITLYLLCAAGTITKQKELEFTGSIGAKAYSDLVLWLPACKQNYVTNQLVTTFYDKSGKGYDFSGGTPPTFAENYVNKRAAILFNGSSNYLTKSDVADLRYDSDFTITLVVKPNAKAKWHWVMYRTSGSWIGFTSNTYMNWNKQPSTDLNSPPSLAGAWHILTYKYVKSTTTLYLYADNVLLTSGSGYVNYTSGGLVMGRNEPYYEYFSGQLAEYIMYRQALSDSDRTGLYNYLKLKYGL